MSSKRPAVLLVLSLAAIAALAACSTGPTPPTVSPSAPATSSAPTTPIPTPEPVAASVAFSAEAIMVLDAAGATLASFDYFQPTAEVVTGLTEYLGAPVDSPNAGGMETPPGIDHVWAGLRLFDTDTPGNAPEVPNHVMFVDGPMAGPLPIATADGVGSPEGVAVGDPPASMTIGVEVSPPYTDPTTGRTVVVSRIGIVTLPPNPADSMPRNIGVMALSYDDTGVIERLSAPSANFGV
ncbi:hypothetical protein [Agromyces sp. Soil535]|uniref:hypothetical protein n=1 Tax=Agromyces sp. Soil535 TaxID=1736390 RepID=UPI0006FFFDF9|nr:hypothetical protein [Agromyces sp. Soil535]KRE23161.1 hypothetical protein ASG80_09985 [Agromyces sp. Soil535]